VSTSRKEFRAGDEGVEVDVRTLGGDRYVVRVRGRERTVTARAAEDGFILLEVDGRLHRCAVARTGSLVQVRVSGRTHVLREPEPRAAQHHGHGVAGDAVEAPMTGTVQKVLVREGQRVSAREPLVLLVAMKMEHRLVAPRDGIVGELLAREGATVDAGTVLVRLRADEG
jgi:acetyl/propionyl-CoA carboxylase alpha subunit